MTHPVTDRQVEALASKALGLPAHHRLNGEIERYGGGISALIGRLENAGYLTPRGGPGSGRLTREGLDVLAENVGRILPELDDIAGTLETRIRAAMRKREVELDAEDDERSRARAEGAVRAQAREAELAARIPAKLRELLAERNLPGLENFARPDARRLDDVLVDLWRAIVNADAAL